MAKDRKNKKMASDVNSEEGIREPDSDEAEHPTTESDADTDDVEFQFDMSLLPKDVELVDLSPDFVRPEGFLMVPRVNKKTGEIFPQTATFVGILHDVVPWVDKHKKERFWFACTATADLPNSQLTGQDDEGEPFSRPIIKGDRVGISSSGAISALKTKKGHLIYLHWTGNQVDVKNGLMWEVLAKVSKEPVVKAPF